MSDVKDNDDDALELAEEINSLLDGARSAEAFVALSMVVAVGLHELRKCTTSDPDEAMADILGKFADSVKNYVQRLEDE